jgi:hypothetical protein
MDQPLPLARKHRQRPGIAPTDNRISLARAYPIVARRDERDFTEHEEFRRAMLAP